MSELTNRFTPARSSWVILSAPTTEQAHAPQPASHSDSQDDCFCRNEPNPVSILLLVSHLPPLAPDHTWPRSDHIRTRCDCASATQNLLAPHANGHLLPLSL